MGLIKWLKKDNNVRRRESAPSRTLQFDPNKTRDQAYCDKMAKFTQFRVNERTQRLSMGPNELCAPNQSIIADAEHDASEREENHFHLQQLRSINDRSYQSQKSEQNHDMDDHNDQTRSNKINVQFHLNDGTDNSETSYNNHHHHHHHHHHQQVTRHSMPIPSQRLYKQKPQHKTKHSTHKAYDTNIIREQCVHADNGSIDNDVYSNPVLSPPMKFYRQNSNPYPNIGITSTSTSISEISDIRPIKCPEKPKRLLLNNSKQTRKFLNEAQFNGIYRNFEIKSPYYSEDSSTMASFSAYKDEMAQSRDTINSLNCDTASQPGRYQVITNKHGEDVEYAIPCIDQAPEYGRKKYPRTYASIADNEIFEEDPAKCEEILDRIAELNSSDSIPEIIVPSRTRKEKIMITDLDKSTEYSLSHDHLNESHDPDQDGNPTIDIQMHPIRSYFESMASADIICKINEFTPNRTEHEIMDHPMLLFTQSGTFKKCNATIRKYVDRYSDPELMYVAETAILRDLDVLRKIRHENIVNLMAIGFEPYRRIALIIEPTKCTLNSFLFEKAQTLNLEEVVHIAVTIAKAVLYLQECNFCHSNISSHTILINATAKTAKLAFFELAVPYKSGIQEEVELQMIQQHRINRSIREIPLKYLPYCVQYRRELSMFNYQAPELLSCNKRFVFPTRQSDTYAITLLLWEMLNRCIPFEEYNENKLDELLQTNYPLRFLSIKEEERCQRFHEILERGLKREPTTRIELEKMISKLNAIELEISRANAKRASPTKLDTGNLKSKEKPLIRRTTGEADHRYDDDEKGTPNKSYSKLSSVGVSPAENLVSPLHNITNSTLQRSLWDPKKVLSPRRFQNETQERNSTLKRRKKITPTKHNNKYVRGSPSDVANVTAQTNELIEAERLSNALNEAHIQSTISKQLDYSIDEENAESEESDDQYKGPPIKIDTHPFDNVPNSNNNTQFSTESYHLPAELIARNNKIRRYIWLSTDQMNDTSQCDQSALAIATKNANESQSQSMPTNNDENADNQRLNVNIKIVRKQFSPENSVQHNSSIKSDCSTASAVNNEESISVKSRIKFFRSLESHPVQIRSPAKNVSNLSRRSEISFKEAKKAIEKSYRHTYPATNTNTSNQQLIKDISNIAAEIQENLANNPYLNGRQTINENNHKLNESNLIIDNYANKDLLDESYGEIDVNEKEQRNSVRDAIQKFELSLRNNLLSEKIFNTEQKLADKLESWIYGDEKKSNVTDEKIEDLIHIVEPCEIENESGTQLALVPSEKTEQPTDEPEKQSVEQLVEEPTEQPAEQTTDHQTKTLIKRTFYQESIVSGHNIEMNDLLSNRSNLVRRKSMTTHVTLNMRKCKRHSSDVGTIDCDEFVNNKSLNSSELMHTSRMSDVRHSIGESPLPKENQSSSIGRKLQHISNETLQSCASGMLFSSKTQIQSIEDLYIDDDFDGTSLAANMELFTNSVDLLDGIDFDLLSTRIYEETTEAKDPPRLTITDVTDEIENDVKDEHLQN